VAESAGPDVAVRPTPSVRQHAIRLLVILHACGEQVKPSDPDGCVSVVRAEMKLQALDFWLRNPDYLAGELLRLVNAEERPVEHLEDVDRLLNDPEPDLHWYPMPRWHYGAYEAIDDAFSVLSSYGLAMVRRRGGVKKVSASQFFLTEAGVKAVADLAAEPVLCWYTDQVKLVALVAGDDNGKTLKKRQYEQAEYANTKLGVTIAPIADAVREELAAVRAELAGKS
jgi:hypothetical protein